MNGPDISARRRELEQELEQLLEAERAAAQDSPSEDSLAQLVETDLAVGPAPVQSTVKSPGKVK